MGRTWGHPAWPAGLDVAVSLVAAPPSAVTVAPSLLGKGAGAAGPMGGTRGNTVDRLV
jgi:hypothetical protein